MIKNKIKVANTLTARVYRELLRQRVMGVQDVAKVCGGTRAATAVLRALAGRGLAVKVHRGLHAAVPFEYEGGYHEVDRYLVAHKAGGAGAVSHHSALELHGVAQSSFGQVYYTRARPMRGFTHQDTEYVFVTDRRLFGTEEVWREGVRVPVTDRERTFLDCLRRMDYCGGLEECLKSVHGFARLDFDLLGKYLHRFGNRSLYQKTGYVLSIGGPTPPGEFLSMLTRKAVGRPCYLAPHPVPGTGRMVREWNIIVPDNIEEMMRFV